MFFSPQRRPWLLRLPPQHRMSDRSTRTGIGASAGTAPPAPGQPLAPRSRTGRLLRSSCAPGGPPRAGCPPLPARSPLRSPGESSTSGGVGGGTVGHHGPTPVHGSADYVHAKTLKKKIAFAVRTIDRCLSRAPSSGSHVQRVPALVEVGDVAATSIAVAVGGITFRCALANHSGSNAIGRPAPYGDRPPPAARARSSSLSRLKLRRTVWVVMPRFASCSTRVSITPSGRTRCGVSFIISPRRALRDTAGYSLLFRRVFVAIGAIDHPLVSSACTLPCARWPATSPLLDRRRSPPLFGPARLIGGPEPKYVTDPILDRYSTGQILAVSCPSCAFVHWWPGGRWTSQFSPTPRSAAPVAGCQSGVTSHLPSPEQLRPCFADLAVSLVPWGELCCTAAGLAPCRDHRDTLGVPPQPRPPSGYVSCLGLLTPTRSPCPGSV